MTGFFYSTIPQGQAFTPKYTNHTHMDTSYTKFDIDKNKRQHKKLVIPENMCNIRHKKGSQHEIRNRNEFNHCRMEKNMHI